MSGSDHTSGMNALNKTGDKLRPFTESVHTVDETDKVISGIPIEVLMPKKAPLMPMSPLAASATVINLILATGPFRYLSFNFNSFQLPILFCSDRPSVQFDSSRLDSPDFLHHIYVYCGSDILFKRNQITRQNRFIVPLASLRISLII